MLVDATKEVISGDVKRVYDILPQLSIMKGSDNTLDFKIVYSGTNKRVIPDLEKKTLFWKDVYTKLAWDERSQDYLDCNGSEIDVDGIVFANKNYALIVTKYNNGDLYVEQQAISSSSRSSYIVNWVDVKTEDVNIEILIPLFDEDILVHNNIPGAYSDMEDMSEFIRTLNAGVSETECTSIISTETPPYHFEDGILVLDGKIYARYVQEDPQYGHVSNLMSVLPKTKIGDVLVVRGIEIHSFSSIVYFGDKKEIDANSVMFEYFLDEECTQEVDIVDMFKEKFGY